MMRIDSGSSHQLITKFTIPLENGRVSWDPNEHNYLDKGLGRWCFMIGRGNEWQEKSVSGV